MVITLYLSSAYIWSRIKGIWHLNYREAMQYIYIYYLKKNSCCLTTVIIQRVSYLRKNLCFGVNEV